jgi:hypothetical protein
VRRARLMRPLNINPAPASKPAVRIIEIVNGRQKRPEPPPLAKPKLTYVEVTLPIPSALVHFPTVDEVVKVVADEYQLKPADIRSHDRRATLVRKRHVAMYLAAHLTKRSLPEIGRQLGFDHSSIIHGRDNVERRLTREPGLYDVVVRLKEQIAERVRVRNGGAK